MNNSTRQRRSRSLGWLLCVIIAPAMAAAPGDLLYERKADDGSVDDSAAAFPPSVFEHWKHRIQYRCDACHDSLFAMELGATPITMESMKKGENCGACHNGDTVFDVGFANCARCHRAPDD